MNSWEPCGDGSSASPGDSFVFARPRRGRPPAQVAPSLFRSECDEPGGVAVCLHLQGSIDSNSALAFRDASFSAIGKARDRICFDLSRVVHVDTHGISHLITVARVAALKGVIVEYSFSRELETLFRETGLDRLLSPEYLRGDQIAKRLLDSYSPDE